jgi:pyruvate kinase
MAPRLRFAGRCEKANHMIASPTVKLLRYRRTKIIATLGPASSTPEILDALVGAGVNVFRLNMSHGTHDTHRATYATVRAVADKSGVEIAIFADLCGPKIRVGMFPGGSIQLAGGQKVVVTTRDVQGAPGLIPSQYAALADDVVAGSRILLDDGNLELCVDAKQGTEIQCTVVNGGKLKDKKGMNLPGVAVSAPALTDKDKEDARFAVALGVDFVALSFVRKGSDVTELRSLLAAAGRDVPIICKIEKPEALENIDAILEASDAIMIARGDLGVELPPQQVPNVQEELVDLARAQSKPVIVATQMLESMIENPRPTRAEVTDVANAVRSGADAVMLSGETAAGAHPVEAVKMMDMVIRQAEGYLFSHGAFATIDSYTPTMKKPEPPIPIDAAVANSAALLSRELLVRGLVVLTRSGRSIEVMSAARPAAPLVGVSSDPDKTKQGCLMWGVIPVTVPDWEKQDPVNLASRLAKELKLVTEGGTILLVRGFSMDPAHNAPSLSIVPIA